MTDNYRTYNCRKCGKNINMFCRVGLTTDLYSYLCPECESEIKTILEEYGFRGDGWMKCSECGKEITEEIMISLFNEIVPVHICLDCAKKINLNGIKLTVGGKVVE